jgi:hypothetical protein
VIQAQPRRARVLKCRPAKGRRTARCTTTLVTPRPTRGTAKLTRRGRLVAKATGSLKRLVLDTDRRLPAGHYTLTLKGRRIAITLR